jgi:dihydroorotate dehydrogenase (fumarate)
MSPAPTTDLTTDYLGLILANPIVASSSPLTGSVETLLQLEAAGAAAVVLPSLFEEQIEHDAMAVHHGLEFGAGHHAEAVGGYFPELDTYNTGPEWYLEALTGAKAALRIPVIASLNGTTAGGWTRFARELQDEGADALELNIYLVAADADVSGAEVEQRYVDLVEATRAAVTIPLAVKVGMARRLAEAGADGLVLFNRFYEPDIVLDDLAVDPVLELSTPADMRLVLHWMALLRGRIDTDLAATSGVHDAAGVVKLLLAGADVAMMASALLAHGPGHLRTVLDETRAWFTERGYESVSQARGSLSQESSPDPSAFERVNYMKTLTSYASKPR